MNLPCQGGHEDGHQDEGLRMRSFRIEIIVIQDYFGDLGISTSTMFN
jgi:hypothetical protein